ncbi:hypothetical protein SCAR479_06007 [Seiridium cardinale]|uniref:Uncharacterized protein n=1 Tax=Seiridium cardinale TaxID=138064 RepID=A0ABR2XTZ5_9PEZI
MGRLSLPGGYPMFMPPRMIWRRNRQPTLDAFCGKGGSLYPAIWSNGQGCMTPPSMLLVAAAVRVCHGAELTVLVFGVSDLQWKKKKHTGVVWIQCGGANEAIHKERLSGYRCPHLIVSSG